MPCTGGITVWPPRAWLQGFLQLRWPWGGQNCRPIFSPVVYLQLTLPWVISAGLLLSPPVPVVGDWAGAAVTCRVQTKHSWAFSQARANASPVGHLAGTHSLGLLTDPLPRRYSQGSKQMFSLQRGRCSDGFIRGDGGAWNPWGRERLGQRAVKGEVRGNVTSEGRGPGGHKGHVLGVP